MRRAAIHRYGLRQLWPARILHPGSGRGVGRSSWLPRDGWSWLRESHEKARAREAGTTKDASRAPRSPSVSSVERPPRPPSFSPTMYTTHLLSLTLIFLFSSSASATSSDPDNAPYPVSNQLPLVARVGQYYSWSISPNTFGTANETVSVSSKLPSWLAFSNLTFSGMPQTSDEGTVDVTISSGGNHDSFQLCVTHYPAPTLNIPIASQFNGSNPSMSSVFFLDSNSALQDNNPALRIPLRWSFSIGFDYGTFVSQNDLFYYALRADGSPLPEWITFDSNTVTFDGVTRSPPLTEGDKISLVFIASDQPGYSAVQAPFDLFIDTHGIYSSGSSVLNVTEGEQFEFDLSQDDWFFDGVVIDNSTIHWDNLTSLTIDTSAVSWLSYNSDNFTLSGTAPSKGSFLIPMTLEAFNQSVTLNASVALLPSYFISATLPGTYAQPGADFKLPIASYLSNTSDLSAHDISLSSNSSASYLSLAPGSDGTNILTGRIPSNPGASFVDVELTAYDHTTHAASHASLRISFRNINSDATQRTTQAQRRRLIYGLSIGLGGAMATVLVAGGMAVIRKCCRVQDSAVGSVPRSSSEKPRDLFDPDLEKDGVGWSEKAGLGLTEVPQVRVTTLYLACKLICAYRLFGHLMLIWAWVTLLHSSQALLHQSVRPRQLSSTISRPQCETSQLGAARDR